MQTYQAAFYVRDREERYTVYRSRGAPEHDCRPGDLYIDAAANNQPGRKVPAQSHPTLGSDWRLNGFDWMYRRKFYPDYTRSRRSEVELTVEYMFGYHDPPVHGPVNLPRTPSPQQQLSLPSSPFSYVSADDANANMVGVEATHTPAVNLTALNPDPLLAPAHQPVRLSSPTPVGPITNTRRPSYAAANLANAWLSEVRDLCFQGPVSRVPGQLAKIDSIFRALMSGPPPSVRDAVEDLLSSSTLQFSDTTTNTVETDVSCRDFIAQQISLGMGETLPIGHRLLVVFDILLTENGLGRCRWACLPFEDDGQTAFCDATNCWTPAGTLTLPHIDDFACGQFMIHWKGKKLWLLWPGTAANLRLMEFTHLTSGDLSTTLMLIDRLEGLQLLYLTEEEFGEYAFYLRIATIHCCISITESCHAGRPIRSIVSTFVADLDIAYGCAMEWMANRLLGSSGCDERKKKELVWDMVGSINHWLNLHDGLNSSPLKKELKVILDRTCTQLNSVGQALGLTLDLS
ncbi:hypothetical protein NMY22_g10946 [Coprinellus aureogranulatus]|nr:hypothetical protein NMY22_g10946 [Coprinellus aureogranulatus]